MSSNWVFDDTSRWTPEDNKQFENALALYDSDTPDRWARVAAMIPGKTANDVMKQYHLLEEDVCDIEAGLIPIPGYDNDDPTTSFTVEWLNCDGIEQFNGPGSKRCLAARASSDQERKKGVPWTEEEHRQFLMGLKKCGKGDWKNIARNFVITRTPTQVASHAQKFFIRQLSGGRDKRRSSIHDITTVNLADDKLPSSDHSSTAARLLQHPDMAGVANTQCDLNVPKQEAVTEFDSIGYNITMSPYCGISSFSYKLPESSQLRGSGQEPRMEPHNMQHQ